MYPKDVYDDWIQAKYNNMMLTAGPHLHEGQHNTIIHRDYLDPHHPFGRHGIYLLCVVWISKGFHKWIHANANQAMKMGWLQPPYRGMPNDPKHPRPWCDNAEDRWPEEVKKFSLVPKECLTCEYDGRHWTPPKKEPPTIPDEQVWHNGKSWFTKETGEVPASQVAEPKALSIPEPKQETLKEIVITTKLQEYEPIKQPFLLQYKHIASGEWRIYAEFDDLASASLELKMSSRAGLESRLVYPDGRIIHPIQS
jgi:hypothetical protein